MNTDGKDGPVNPQALNEVSDLIEQLRGKDPKAAKAYEDDILSRLTPKAKNAVAELAGDAFASDAPEEGQARRDLAWTEGEGRRQFLDDAADVIDDAHGYRRTYAERFEGKANSRSDEKEIPSRHEGLKQDAHDAADGITEDTSPSNKYYKLPQRALIKRETKKDCPKAGLIKNLQKNLEVACDSYETQYAKMVSANIGLQGLEPRIRLEAAKAKYSFPASVLSLPFMRLLQIIIDAITHASLWKTLQDMTTDYNTTKLDLERAEKGMDFWEDQAKKHAKKIQTAFNSHKDC